MVSLGKPEMRRVYRFTKVALFITGISLFSYGAWFFAYWKLNYPDSSDFWFGIFPMYLGAMSFLIAFAMREDWFTDARKYW